MLIGHLLERKFCSYVQSKTLAVTSYTSFHLGFKVSLMVFVLKRWLPTVRTAYGSDLPFTSPIITVSMAFRS